MAIISFHLGNIDIRDIASSQGGVGAGWEEIFVSYFHLVQCIRLEILFHLTIILVLLTQHCDNECIMSILCIMKFYKAALVFTDCFTFHWTLTITA